MRTILSDAGFANVLVEGHMFKRIDLQMRRDTASRDTYSGRQKKRAAELTATHFEEEGVSLP